MVVQILGKTLYPRDSSVAAAAAAAMSSDRRWFERNPVALVRFRPIRKGEFAQIERYGEVPPAFVPAPLRGTSALTWVVVVDLTRCLRDESDDLDLSLRIRLQTVPLRSKAMQRTWAPVYLRAVLNDLLHQMELFNDSDDCQVA